MVGYEGEVRRHIGEFVGSGYDSSDMFLTAKLYQKIQLNLRSLAEKLHGCDSTDKADEIIGLSESLHEIYSKMPETKCDKE